jgi:hypothetical protein
VVAPLPYQAMCIPVLRLSHSGMCSASSRSGFPVGRYDIAGRAVLTVDDIRLTSHSTRALDSHGELLLLPMKIYTYRRSATAGGSRAVLPPLAPSCPFHLAHPGTRRTRGGRSSDALDLCSEGRHARDQRGLCGFTPSVEEARAREAHPLSTAGTLSRPARCYAARRVY